MSKLLSQGGFGCVFYPGITCSGKSRKNDKIVTKIQARDFNSDNESLIGEIIQTLPNYKLYFLPVVDSCKIDVRTVKSKDLMKCDVINNSVKETFVGMDLPYLDGENIVNALIDKRAGFIIRVISESYIYLLNAVELLKKVNVLHMDIKSANIIYKKNSSSPRIIDFGISIPCDNLTNDNMKKYFYGFSPEYFVWALEIHVINYLLHETENSLTKKDIDIISESFVSSNAALDLFSVDFVNKYLSKTKSYLKKYVNMPKETAIQKLLETRWSWDLYSLSIMYLRIIFALFSSKKENIFIKNIIGVLKTNINPDFNDRIDVKKARENFYDIFYMDGDVNEFIELKMIIEKTKNNNTKNLKKMLLESKSMNAQTVLN
jgi:serine/threonine protein kinase